MNDVGANLQIFFGQLTSAEARIYAKLDGVTDSSRIRISGAVAGPSCRYARTLAARIPFRKRAGGADVLAEAIVPDPCFWTPEMPYLYEAYVEVCDGEELVAATSQSLGLRPIAVADRRLLSAGRNFVVRAAHAGSLVDVGCEELHAAEVALAAGRLSDRDCADASETGVLVLAELGETELESELARLTRHAAVAIAVLPPREALPGAAAAVGRNVVFATRPRGAPAPSWARLLIVDAGDGPRFAEGFASSQRPVIAERRLAGPVSPAEARRACDQLQADLNAALRATGCAADPVGYLV